MKELEKEIQDLKKKVEELEVLKRDFLFLLENTPDFIYIKDSQHRFTSTSRAFAELTGHKDWRELIGKTDFDIFPPEHAEEYFKFEKPVIENGQSLINHEEPYYDKNKELRWVSSSKRPVFGEDGQVIGLIGISKDITDLKNSKLAIERMAKYDFLTGLANRYLFNELANSAMLYAHRSNKNLALFFIDLDDFKEVNDTYGHDVGDKLLVSFSKTVKAYLRESDIIARLGGDEFIILLHDVSGKVAIIEVAKRILTFVSKKIEINETIKIGVSCSMGIALYPEDANELEKLIACADIAMYKSKLKGKNQFTFHEK
ncbi:MAG: diguanylate cyclase [Leptospiraceae bacterium]|nr:diguanylate cyclase [Leptospiraceae bacterium]MCP5499910.1 diguanylate cyclase [Leptospiraceae bacterium]